MSRRLTWGGPPEVPPPKRPYRDSVVLYAVLAVVIVIVAWATGGSLRNAIGWAVAFFVLAVAWSIYAWRGRLRRAAREEEARRARAEGDT